MACPYFLPGEIHPRELWPRRHSLPLGDGFTGGCARQKGEACTEDQLRGACNLGYADCERLPGEREFDAVRFACRMEHGRVHISLCAERGHLPGLILDLQYDVPRKSWFDEPEKRFRPLAEAALRAFLARRQE